MATETPQPDLGQRPRYRRDGSSVSSPPRKTQRHYARRVEMPSLDARTLAEGLGWFSVALGAAAIVAPRSISSLSGIGRANRGVARSIGVRELATGIGILSSRNPAPWLWSRAVGDVVDLAVLLTAMRPGAASRGRAAASFMAVAGLLAVDAVVASQMTRHAGHPLISGVAAPTDLYFEASIATHKSPDECYRFWRDIDNLPRFMGNVESVKALDERRFHWVARGADGAGTLDWDCEITEDRPGAALAWRTLNGAQLPNAGSVIFERAPQGRGTIVRLSIHYSPVGGRLTAALAKLLRQDPQTQVQEDLRRFKQLLETGELATTRGQPTGRRSFFGRAARYWNLTKSN